MKQKYEEGYLKYVKEKGATKKDLFINPNAKDAMKKHEQYLREVK